MKTILTILIDHAKPIENLGELVAQRAYTIDRVTNTLLIGSFQLDPRVDCLACGRHNPREITECCKSSLDCFIACDVRKLVTYATPIASNPARDLL